jgi:hypothetical protein
VRSIQCRQLFTRPRLIVYGIIAFGPGTLAWLLLHSVKLEMEKDNEAARLVMVGKARAEVEEEERKEVIRKAELEGVLHRVETLHERLKAMEHVIFGTTSPESLENPGVIRDSTKETVSVSSIASETANTRAESHERSVATPPPVSTTKALRERLHAFLWDEECQYEEWLTFCKRQLEYLWNSWPGKIEDTVEKKMESDTLGMDRGRATVGDLSQKTMSRLPPQPNVIWMRIQEILKGTSEKAQAMRMEKSVPFPAPELTSGEYVCSLWKNEKQETKPMADEDNAEKVKQRLASYYQSDIARRKEEAHQGTNIRHN